MFLVFAHRFGDAGRDQYISRMPRITDIGLPADSTTSLVFNLAGISFHELYSSLSYLVITSIMHLNLMMLLRSV